MLGTVDADLLVEELLLELLEPPPDIELKVFVKTAPTLPYVPFHPVTTMTNPMITNIKAVQLIMYASTTLLYYSTWQQMLYEQL